MTKKLIDAEAILNQAKPLTGQHAHEIQPFGHLVKLPIALSERASDIKRHRDRTVDVCRSRLEIVDAVSSITSRWVRPVSGSSLDQVHPRFAGALNY